MKKIVLSLVSMVLVLSQIFAQSDTSKISTNVSLTITTMQFGESMSKVTSFLQSNSVYIIEQVENKASFNSDFILNEKQYQEFEKLIPTFGFVAYKNISTTNNNTQSLSVQHEIDYLNNQKKAYDNLLVKMSDVSEQYLTTWRELKEIEQKIFEKEQILLKYQVAYNTYTVHIEIEDETTTPNSSKVAFVNMPGGEFSYLQIENPMAGLSNDIYQGYFVKYLFTKGKSYINIGAYQAIDGPVADTSYYSEMFIFSFGQDFYSRYLGRGSKKTLNLYSSYSLGGMLASGISTQEYIGYIAPAIGVELFKNKYILLDAKASYFLPITEQNRNMRGISYSASLNFVF